MYHLQKHIKQNIKRRNSKDKDSTVNKTKYQSTRNPMGKARWAQQTAKASGPYHLINRYVFKLELSSSLKEESKVTNRD